MILIPEIMTWIIGCAVLLFGISQFRYLQRIPRYRLLALSYFAMLLAWSCTILENFFWRDVLYTLEHTFLLLGIVTLAGWCYQVFRNVRADI